MNTTFGFIGAGNMGGALAKAAAKAMAPENITLADQLTEKAEALAAQLGCKTATAETVAQTCGFIFLGVKPQVMGAMLSQVAPMLAARKDGFVLVDYKNIQGEEANPEHYTSQMEAYREVVESAGHKCKGIILFYATLGQIIELK